MKKIFLIICSLYFLNAVQAQTLQTVTTTGNTTTNALRLTGEANIGTSGNPELVLGFLSTLRSNDTRAFIGWKGDAATNITTNGQAGALLLQPRTNLADMSIDFATGNTTPLLRMRVAGNGNVSIGDNSLIPASRLLIKGSGATNATTSFLIQNSVAGEALRVLDNGNVGIGTAAPAYKLQITGNTRVNGFFALSGTQQTPNYIYANEYADNSTLLIKAGSSGTIYSQIEVSGNWNGTNQIGGKVAFSTAGAERMRIDAAGNIGIGTTAPNAKLDVVGNIFCSNKLYIGTYDGTTNTQIASYALAVNGTAIFNKAKVKLYGNWPDYVFDDKYNLMPLTEVEKFLKINKHLPEVPSAAEIEKDGIDLGDNQSILLKKVEELTLYMIDQNKKIAIQQLEIDNLKNQVTLLQKK